MKKTTLYIACIVLISLFMILDLLTGTVSISFSDLMMFISGREVDDSTHNILTYFRIPKMLTAIIAGVFLPVCGLLMQTFFRNPIAGPYILGISAGASLGVATITLTGLSLGFLGGLMLETVFSAFLGALFVLSLLLLIYRRVRDINSLLIIGLMIGSGTSAVISLFQFFTDKQSLQQFIFWTMGSIQETSYQQLTLLFIIGLLILWIPFRLASRLDVLLMGDAYARQIGLNVHQVRKVIIFVTALLTAAITAFCGPIAFIGIAVPHLARMVFKTYKHQDLLIGSALIGILVMLFCDILCHLPTTGIVLPINVVTSLLGVPMVVWIVMTQHKLGKE